MKGGRGIFVATGDRKGGSHISLQPPIFHNPQEAWERLPFTTTIPDSSKPLLFYCLEGISTPISFIDILYVSSPYLRHVVPRHRLQRSELVRVRSLPREQPLDPNVTLGLDPRDGRMFRIYRPWRPPLLPARDPGQAYYHDKVPDWIARIHALDQTGFDGMRRTLPPELSFQIANETMKMDKCLLDRLRARVEICSPGEDRVVQEQLRVKRVDAYVVPEHTEMRRVATDYEHDKYDGEKDCPVARGSGRLLRAGWDHGEGRII